MRPITENKLYQDLAMVTEYCRMVSNGDLRGVLISGPPGIGKTFLAEAALRAAGKRWRLINPTPAALVEILWNWRRGGTLLTDDSDSFLRSERHINIVKRVMDMKDRRQIADDRKIDGRGVFDIACGMVYLTNIDINDMTQFSADMREHIKAFKSRCYVKRLSFSPIDCYEYSVWLATEERMLKNEGLSLAQSNEVMEYFRENCWRFIDHEVSPRRIVKIARLSKASKMWREMMEQDLSAEPWTDLPLPELVRVMPPARKIAEPLPPPNLESVPAKRQRKALTPEQREQKQKADRERRKAKKVAA